MSQRNSNPALDKWHNRYSMSGEFEKRRWPALFRREADCVMASDL